MTDLVTQTKDPSLTGLFYAISFQIVGIAIAFMASSVNFAFLLFADTIGHEIALSIPIIATALFTIVWGDAALRSQIAHIKDASNATRKTNAHKDISVQPYGVLRLMNLGLAIALATSQFTILFS
tara:strand:+ start:90 stop:464 length:375 start_codon:yes stop_codon:yes gene_type:complete